MLRTPIMSLFLLTVCWVSPVCGLERANLLFYLPFETNIVPAIAGGKSESAGVAIQFEAGSEKDIQLVPGLRGSGLQAKPGLSFQYQTKESFSRRERSRCTNLSSECRSGRGHRSRARWLDCALGMAGPRDCRFGHRSTGRSSLHPRAPSNTAPQS